MDISKEEFRTYVHNNEDYLIEWENIKEYDSSSFNFYVLLFGFFWMLYRKMYLAAFLFVTVLSLTNFTDYLFCCIFYDDFFYRIFGSFTRYLPILTPFLLRASVTVAFGFYANRLYIRDAEQKIYNLKKLNLPEEEYFSRLRKKGGISWLSVLAVLIIWGGISYYEPSGPAKASKAIGGPIGIMH